MSTSGASGSKGGGRKASSGRSREFVSPGGINYSRGTTTLKAGPRRKGGSGVPGVRIGNNMNKGKKKRK